MDSTLRALVKERANHRCEYCLVPEALSYHPFHIEHVTAQKHGGTDEESNLALACRNCNLHKGSNLSGIDPVGGDVVQLFNPRVDTWSDHFIFRGSLLDGKTDRGRATIRVLCINDEDQVAIREALGLYGAG